MRSLRRRSAALAACLFATLCAAPSGTRAQLPDRPIRIIVPSPPGGTGDLAAPLLGRPTVVDNRAGANGHIGMAEAARAPADGTVDVFFDNLPSILPQIRAGTVQPVAVLSAERAPELPEVATFAEAGAPGVVIDSWFGFLAPARTPPATVAALNAAFAAALAEPALRRRLAEAGVVPLGGSPERMGEHIRTELSRWAEVVRTNDIRAE
ncbi:Bug family tripartite tricarboxylate transporter substrate binding protein [Roseomonas sp. BN140053]|uniref:Bug family tripartite tricarboxylate transporter substrate binding protein n=1 Tax=Roseomonas sp. BN140053 TaxID=3391898 RepID=UPI0039EB7D80